MTEMRVTGRSSGKEPNYKKTAPALHKLCIEFYADPENIKAFEEWKAGKERQDEKEAV